MGESERGATDDGEGHGGDVRWDSSALTWLYGVEQDPRRRRGLTAAALAVGLALATLHWGGLLVGGALVGLVQPTLRRALLAGLGFGVAVLAVAAARFALAGTFAEVGGTWPLVGVGVAIALVAGPLGATARGLLPDAPSGEK